MDEASLRRSQIGRRPWQGSRFARESAWLKALQGSQSFSKEVLASAGGPVLISKLGTVQVQ
jgi:hypothetical protein